MKQFASAGFRLWNLSLPAKVLYSAFCVLTQLGIVSSALYYGALVGGGFEGVRAYYAGEEAATSADARADAPPDNRPAVAGPAIDLPSDGSRQLVVAMTYRKLLEVTHFHLFTMPVVLLIVGHLFFATGVGERAKMVWILAASAGVALHIATPWLVRYGGGALAPLHTFSGIFMGTCMTVVTVYPVYAMWFGRSPERAPSRDDRPNV
jgi:hypothetical protein